MDAMGEKDSLERRCQSGEDRGWSESLGEITNGMFAVASLGQQELSLFGTSKPVELTFMFNPDLVSAAT